MFSVAPNILLAPNMTQNAERKHRTQNTNTAHFRSSKMIFFTSDWTKESKKLEKLTKCQNSTFPNFPKFNLTLHGLNLTLCKIIFCISRA